MTPASDTTIKFNVGVPQIFCPKWTTGKSIESRYPGERVMFTAVDSRKIFLDGDEARTLEEGMRRWRIKPGEDFVRVTREKYGTGSILRVERVADAGDAPRAPRADGDAPAAPPARSGDARSPSALEAKLEKSVELARAHGRAAFRAGEPAPPVNQVNQVTVRLTECFLSAVDAITEAQRYARSRELGVTFTSEDVRAVAISAFIQGEKLALVVDRAAGAR